MSATEPRIRTEPPAVRTPARSQATTLILARHGETELNVDGRLRGRSEPPLTRKGRDQAEALGERLVEHGPKAVYSSPRARALETSAPVSTKLGLEPRVDPALDDLDYGDWTGKTLREVEEASPALYRTWRDDPGAVSFPQGEAMGDVVARVRAFFAFVRTLHAGHTVVAVTHDAWIRIAICAALDAPLAAYHRIAVDLTSTTGVIPSVPARVLWVNCGGVARF